MPAFAVHEIVEVFEPGGGRAIRTFTPRSANTETISLNAFSFGPPSFSASRTTSVTLSGNSKIDQPARSQRRPTGQTCGFHDRQNSLDAFAQQKRFAVDRIGKADDATPARTERQFLFTPLNLRLAVSSPGEERALDSSDRCASLWVGRQRDHCREKLLIRMSELGAESKAFRARFRRGDAARSQICFDQRVGDRLRP